MPYLFDSVARNLAAGTAFAMIALLGSSQVHAAQGSSPRKNRSFAKSAAAERPFRPNFVVGGNGVSLQMPLQLSAGGYIPRWRFGFGYQRQIFRKHWAYAQAALLVDRGNWETFGSETCGLLGVEGPDVCGKGAVAGFELAAGYEHRFFLADYPYLVPSARAGLGFATWKYPHQDGSRLQARMSAWSLDLRVGGGIRWFLTHQLGVGVDLNLKIAWVRHKDRPLLGGNQPSEVEHDSDAALGFEILPLCGEFRF